MKQPNLSYNPFFPFYTQKKVNPKNGHGHWRDTIMHISAEKGIRVRLEYNRKKISGLDICMTTDRRSLLDARLNHTPIHYTEFAKEVGTCYTEITKAIRTLSKEKAYRKDAYFEPKFKYNSEMKLSTNWGIFSRSYIKIEVGKINYKIQDGKKVNPVQDIDTLDELGLEKDSPLRALTIALDAIEAKTTYSIVPDDKFLEGIDDVWIRLLPYFSNPKFLRKTEYKPK